MEEFTDKGVRAETIGERQEEDMEGEWIRMEEMVEWRTGKLRRETNVTLIKEIRGKMGIEERSSVEIYTDGSKMENRGANCIGIVVKEDEMEIWREEGYSINNMATIFTTEVIAIEKAIEMATVEYTHKDAMILTDSMSAIKAILNEGNECGGSTRIGNIRRKLTERERRCRNDRRQNSGVGAEGKLRLAWIPAHEGITGNERADGVAKENTKGTPDKGIKIPVKDMQRDMEAQAWRKSSRDMKEEGRYKGVKYFSSDNNNLGKKPHGFENYRIWREDQLIF